LRNLVIFAVGADGLDAGVDLVLQLGVLLADAGADAGPEDSQIRRNHALQVAALLALVRFQEGVKRDGIGLHGIEPAGGKILVGLVLGLVFLDFRGFREVLLGVVGMHGRDLD